TSAPTSWLSEATAISPKASWAGLPALCSHGRAFRCCCPIRPASDRVRITRRLSTRGLAMSFGSTGARRGIHAPGMKAAGGGYDPDNPAAKMPSKRRGLAVGAEEGEQIALFGRLLEHRDTELRCALGDG